jgi:hypothetical protein
MNANRFDSLQRNLGKIFTISFIALALGFFPQSSASQEVQLLNKNLPSVYLTYESVSPTSGNNTILLQLHNNTNVSINVSANFSTQLAATIEDGSIKLPDGSPGTLLKSGSEVELCYDSEGLFVEKSYSKPKKMRNPEITDFRNSCSLRSNGKFIDDPYSMGYWLRSNGFIRFRVPERSLRKGLKVYSQFRYPWEFSNSRIRSNEPQHRVYFFYSDVPRDK